MKQLLLICTLFVNLVDIDSVYANEANAKIPGYDLHSKKLVTSPVSLKDLESLKKSLLFGEEDIKALRMSKAILADQTEAILDVWYGFVASTPELVYFFKNNKTGQPDADYLAAVRKRFA